MFENLEQLVKIIRERKNSSSSESYTNKLLHDKDLSVAKVKEEIGELIEAVEENSNQIHEAADVIYVCFFSSINHWCSSFNWRP